MALFGDNNVQLYATATVCTSINDGTDEVLDSLDRAKDRAKYDLSNKNLTEVIIYKLVEVGRVKRQQPLFVETKEAE